MNSSSRLPLAVAFLLYVMLWSGSMVAAACGKLRTAMGPNWRGKTVTVTNRGKTIAVRLVDWCGSKTKLIDLYWEPMRRLGGTGTLPVVVRW